LIRDVEDYLSNEGNKKHDADEMSETMTEISNKIAKIYACINKEYLGM